MGTDNEYKRQQDILLPGETNETSITVVGAGGIGSWTAAILSKLGVRRITVWDFDKVEEHNLPSQFYSRRSVGQPKAQALNSEIKTFTGRKIIYKNGRASRVNTNILIVAVDSMEERIKLCDDCFRYDYVIDARMGLEQMEIYVCKSRDEWKATLHDPDKVDKDPCTARSIVYNTAVIGGIISSIVKKIMKGEKYPKSFIFDLKTYMLVIN